MSEDLISERDQLLETDRATRMDSARRDADFCAKAKLSAIAKLGRGVPQGHSRIDLRKEALRHNNIVGYNRIGMRGTMTSNVIKSFGRAFNNLYRQNGI